jgi:hypothetical protein
MTRPDHDSMLRLRTEDPAEKLLKHVYVLSYLQQYSDGRWTGTFVGVYSSLEQAEEAKKRLLSRPSYRDYPHSFRVDGVMLDVDYDDSHFFTTSQPPPPGPPPDDASNPKSPL